jgi:methylglutaconyl-CoA hydratase
MIVINSVNKNTGIITLNRAEKRNALNPELITAIKKSLDNYISDDKIKVVVITGEGNAFSAGADLEYLLSLRNNTVEENRADSRSIAELFLNIYEFPKPVIAAVNGPAIAGGCGIASVCDFIIAHKQNSRFGYSEVKIGFVPAIVSIFLLKRIGEGKARQLLLTGQIINGERALEIGLADYISEDPVKTALDLSDELQNNSMVSIEHTKKMIRDIATMNTKDAVEYCIELNTRSRSSEDFFIGLNSFLTKQKEK